jgi:hypothetical protein
MRELIEIVDRFGRRRRARPGEIIADGERIHIPMTFMDAEAREVADYLDQKYGRHSEIVDGFGYAAGHRPSHLYDSNGQLCDAAAKARDERIARISSAWRTKHNDGDDGGDRRPARTLTLDQTRSFAEGAWLDKKGRISTAWKDRHEQ